MASRIPMTIITGYLGSGKTTLLRHILKNTDRKVAVVMNEFGDIGIDQKVIKGKNVDIAELEGGCVCCSLTGELEQALKEIMARSSPDWIVLETTGTAEPDAIIINMDVIEGVRLDAVITVADSDAMARFPQLGRIGEVQIEMGNIILLNKADLVPDEKMSEIEGQVRKINPKAVLYRTEKCRIPIELLFGPAVHKRPLKLSPTSEPSRLEAGVNGLPGENMEAKRKERQTPNSPISPPPLMAGAVRNKEHAHKGLDTFFFTSSKTFDRKKFERLVDSLPGEIYRAKGFIRFSDGHYLFNYVAGRRSLEKFSAERTEIVFIGPAAKARMNSIVSGLEECEK